MNNARTPATVGHVVKRMRRLLGHLGKHDRETVLEWIEAILELSTRLHEATSGAPKHSADLVKIRREPLDVIATDGGKVTL